MPKQDTKPLPLAEEIESALRREEAVLSPDDASELTRVVIMPVIDAKVRPLVEVARGLVARYERGRASVKPAVWERRTAARAARGLPEEPEYVTAARQALRDAGVDCE